MKALMTHESKASFKTKNSEILPDPEAETSFFGALTKISSPKRQVKKNSLLYNDQGNSLSKKSRNSMMNAFERNRLDQKQKGAHLALYERRINQF